MKKQLMQQVGRPCEPGRWLRAVLAAQWLVAAAESPLPQDSADPASEDPPVQLDPITVTPPDDPLLRSDQHLHRLIDESLPGLGDGAKPLRRRSSAPPNPKDSVFARPEDPAGGMVYDIKKQNSRQDKQLP